MVNSEVKRVPHGSLNFFLFVRQVTDEIVDTSDMHDLGDSILSDFLFQSIEITVNHIIYNILVVFKALW